MSCRLASPNRLTSPARVSVPARGGGCLLTTLPSLCFGLGAPLAPALARWLGNEQSVLLALLMIALAAAGQGVHPGRGRGDEQAWKGCASRSRPRFDLGRLALRFLLHDETESLSEAFAKKR